jgi:hypothetical protein
MPGSQAVLIALLVAQACHAERFARVIEVGTQKEPS